MQITYKGHNEFNYISNICCILKVDWKAEKPTFDIDHGKGIQGVANDKQGKKKNVQGYRLYIRGNNQQIENGYLVIK